MKLSVSIVTMNQKEKLRDCLLSLQNSEVQDLEIIVVDNASNDGTFDTLIKEFRDVMVIRNAENRGFSRAHNQAIQKSHGDYILILNDDIVVKKGCLSSMLSFIEQDPHIGMAGCRFLYPDGRPQESSFLFPPTFKQWISRRVKRKKPDHSLRHKTDYVMGAFMLIPKKVLNEVGLFDERFFIFCEEIDLAYRITRRGYEIWYNPEGEIIHYHGVTTRHHEDPQKRLWFSLLGFKNMFLFYKKNYGTLELFFYRIRTFTGLLMRWPGSKDPFGKELWKHKIKAVFRKTI